MKKESEERIDEILDQYLVKRIKDEKKAGRNKLISRKNILYHDMSSNHNHIDNNTFENNRNNSNHNHNLYFLHSLNFNFFGNQTKSSDTFSNDFINTQKYSLSLMKKKSHMHKLTIKNVIGNLFKENFLITINEYGIESFTPLRRKYDGVTKFGPLGYDKEGKPINDFQIIIPENLKNEIETLFMIEYDNVKQKYVLIPNYLDENQELNIFIKLEKRLPIEHNYTFSLGEVHFSVEPKSGGAIELEMNMENGESESYLFGMTKEIVKIGRCKKCDIILKSLAYSRVQTTLYYNKEENIWYIQDGFDEKKSMNGTWLYINVPWEISIDTQVRVGQSLLVLNVT